jgi:hypothetical protein
MEDQGDSISWFQGGRVELGPRTRLRWQAQTSALQNGAGQSGDLRVAARGA